MMGAAQAWAAGSAAGETCGGREQLNLAPTSATTQQDGGSEPGKKRSGFIRAEEEEVISERENFCHVHGSIAQGIIQAVKTLQKTRSSESSYEHLSASLFSPKTPPEAPASKTQGGEQL